MNKNVLVVEDEGRIFDMIKDEFIGMDYNIVRARNVSQAKGEYIKFGEKYFDCYVVDLQIDPLGLNEDEAIEFIKFEGYAWIKQYVLKNLSEDEKEVFKKKTIICTKYKKEFEEKYFREEIKDFKCEEKTNGFEGRIKKLIHEICK